MKEDSLRIAIVGTSGSGKSTLARKVSDTLGCNHIELDTHLWLPNWEKNIDDVFLDSVTSACKKDCWVSCGNYSLGRDVVWGCATHLIWLKLPFYLVFWQTFTRTIKRVWKKESIAGGNIETFRQQFFTKNSIFLWIIQTHRRRTRVYEKLLEEGAYAPLKVIILKSRKEMNDFINKLEQGSAF